MNDKLAKEARRNLRKEMGATATDALERARAEVLQLRMEHAAIAKTLADVTTKLNARIDGTSAWCEQTEQQVGVVRHQMKTGIERAERLTMSHVEMSTHFAERMNSVIHGGFWVRLRWMLFGMVPGQWVSPFSDVAPAQAQASVAPTQVVVE